MKSPITTHVLDTSLGKPAVGITVVLEIHTASKEWKEIARGKTDNEGRASDLLPENSPILAGTYRLTFFTAEYFRAVGAKGFYPYIPVVFELQNPESHYHVPLLLNPFGYSTYRGT